MAYSKWRKANMSELERHTVLEALSGFKSYKQDDQSGIDEKTGMSHRMAKRGLQWLKKVKDLKMRKDQIKITDVQSLSEEACMMADDMFEEANVTPGPQAPQKQDSFLSCSSGRTDVTEEENSSSSEDDLNLDEILNDAGMQDLFSSLNEEGFPDAKNPTTRRSSTSKGKSNMGNLFGGLGDMMGGLVTGMMGGFVGKKNPIIIMSLENILDQLREKMNKSNDLSQEEIYQIDKAEKKIEDLISAYDDPTISSDDLTKMYIAATQEATKAGVSVNQNPQQISSLANNAYLGANSADFKNMEKQLAEGCHVM